MLAATVYEAVSQVVTGDTLAATTGTYKADDYELFTLRQLNTGGRC